MCSPPVPRFSELRHFMPVLGCPSIPPGFATEFIQTFALLFAFCCLLHGHIYHQDCSGGCLQNVHTGMWKPQKKAKTATVQLFSSLVEVDFMYSFPLCYPTNKKILLTMWFNRLYFGLYTLELCCDNGSDSTALSGCGNTQIFLPALHCAKKAKKWKMGMKCKKKNANRELPAGPIWPSSPPLLETVRGQGGSSAGFFPPSCVSLIYFIFAFIGLFLCRVFRESLLHGSDNPWLLPWRWQQDPGSQGQWHFPDVQLESIQSTDLLLLVLQLYPWLQLPLLDILSFGGIFPPFLGV